MCIQTKKDKIEAESSANNFFGAMTKHFGGQDHKMENDKIINDGMIKPRIPTGKL